ncbi:Cytochrome P450 monooxygenase trt6 [Lasiodiplodia theobromae]|uniref:Cytochrome P450 monooxygenase trt6 n=1 Tax=Lasiodiplodia theobromae TaxID=45133 RepID=A0A5N5DPG4_9PEZI|nr:Cytochrome P450 monooxygenase trt6 [Lasiodiplodia theobromae]
MDDPMPAQAAAGAATGAPATTMLLANQSTTFYLQLVATAVVLLLAAIHVRRERLYPVLPVAFLQNEKDYEKAKKDWGTSAKEVVAHGLNIFRKPFQVVSPIGPKIILPNSYVNEIKSDKRFSFGKWTANEFLSHLDGFEGFGKVFETPVFTETVRTKLTQALGTLTDDLCQESELTLLDSLGEPKEWTSLVLKPFTLDYVARLSTRVFLGESLCRNREWLDVFVNYTVEAFVAVQQLRHYPAWLRPVVNAYLPGPRKVRASIAQARKLIVPEIEKRRKAVAEAAARGEKVKGKDTVSWMDEVAKGRPFDPVLNQLFFSVAALHTTSGLITQAVLDLVSHPDVIEDLRAEVRQVLKEEGWKKTSLYKMRLMDSFLKESQRVNPPGLLVMNRVAEEAVTLSDGTHIPKGAVVSCSMDNLSNPAIYPDPEKFDARRFLRMREQPGQENSWQFVTTSPEHLGFGHGTHACPGRFFASNEAKIALAYLLLMYDIRLPGGVTERPPTFGKDAEFFVDPAVKIEFRRREENVPRE